MSSEAIRDTLERLDGITAGSGLGWERWTFLRSVRTLISDLEAERDQYKSSFEAKVACDKKNAADADAQEARIVWLVARLEEAYELLEAAPLHHAGWAKRTCASITDPRSACSCGVYDWVQRVAQRSTPPVASGTVIGHAPCLCGHGQNEHHSCDSSCRNENHYFCSGCEDERPDFVHHFFDPSAAPTSAQTGEKP